jgi:hypothetical protein
MDPRSSYFSPFKLELELEAADVKNQMVRQCGESLLLNHGAHTAIGSFDGAHHPDLLPPANMLLNPLWNILYKL